ncbi:accessory gene regulator ArgB-like protein [Desulforamulus aquiferis]|uniref:Accessory gene regulator B family protein n=1 Tax=Desulforamulus aquiferis TaxID=1397668 RepID=A0AAW7ZFW7_9FIRM|nr:accessory gene regulator B family protein [Desulforamulus aquiferis]MDO7788689.1 accessory gene regulator B family protein [Desulforamulus aquiferis]
MKTNYNNLIENWSDNIAQYMQGDRDNNKAIVAYGLNVVIFNTFVFLATIITAIILGLTVPVFMALIASGSLRFFTGGYHCSQPHHCTIITVIMINLYGYLALVISPMLTLEQLAVILGIIMVLCLYFIIKNAPVETPNKPIKIERRPILKRIGIMVWFFWVVTLTLLVGFTIKDYTYIILAVGMGIASQTFSISGILKNREV